MHVWAFVFLCETILSQGLNACFCRTEQHLSLAGGGDDPVQVTNSEYAKHPSPVLPSQGLVVGHACRCINLKFKHYFQHLNKFFLVHLVLSLIWKMLLVH